LLSIFFINKFYFKRFVFGVRQARERIQAVVVEQRLQYADAKLIVALYLVGLALVARVEADLVENNILVKFTVSDLCRT
jgi:hypothetical protein